MINFIDVHKMAKHRLFFPSGCLFFPVLFFMLRSTYYSQNYASIIRHGLFLDLINFYHRFLPGSADIHFNSSTPFCRVSRSRATDSCLDLQTYTSIPPLLSVESLEAGQDTDMGRRSHHSKAAAYQGNLTSSSQALTTHHHTPPHTTTLPL